MTVKNLTRPVVDQEDDSDSEENIEESNIVIPPVPLARGADRIGHGGADFAWIAVKNIRIDAVYQRGLNVRLVNQIAEKFDVDVFGVVLLAKRNDGSLWCLDGQHRIAAVQTMYGYDSDIKVPCFIVRRMSNAGEARIFFKMNRHRLSPSAADAFKARIAFGDEIAVEIAQLLRDKGVTLRLGVAGSLKFHEVQAIGELESIFRQGMLPDVLDIIRESWHGEDGAHKAKNLRGIYVMLSVWHDDFFGDMLSAQLRAARRRRLVDAIAALPPSEMDKRAKFYQNSIGSSVGEAIARAIHAQFNRGLRGNVRLPSWGEGDPDEGEE